MPNLKTYEGDKDALNEYYRNYRMKNEYKIREYNREYSRKRREKIKKEKLSTSKKK